MGWKRSSWNDPRSGRGSTNGGSTRASGHLQATVYCRNVRWALGQPASFEEQDAHPSAVEWLLDALACDLVTGPATACAQAGLDVDEIEVTARGRRHDVMAHLGPSGGDPSFAGIEVTLLVSTFDDADRLRETWRTVVARSPLPATLAKSAELTTTVAIV